MHQRNQVLLSIKCSERLHVAVNFEKVTENKHTKQKEREKERKKQTNKQTTNFSVKIQCPAFLGARVNVFPLSHLIILLIYDLQIQIYKLIHCFHNN